MIEDRLHDQKVAQLQKILAQHKKADKNQEDVAFSIRLNQTTKLADISVQGSADQIISAAFTGLLTLRDRLQNEEQKELFDDMVLAATIAYNNKALEEGGAHE